MKNYSESIKYYEKAIVLVDKSLPMADEKYQLLQLQD